MSTYFYHLNCHISLNFKPAQPIKNRQDHLEHQGPVNYTRTITGVAGCGPGCLQEEKNSFLIITQLDL